MPSIISKIRILIPDKGDRPRERKKGGSVKNARYRIPELFRGSVGTLTPYLLRGLNQILRNS